LNFSDFQIKKAIEDELSNTNAIKFATPGLFLYKKGYPGILEGIFSIDSDIFLT
jgi:hypothetical protein